MKADIVVTEDDQVQRDIIADILEQAGYTARRMASAQDALESLTTDGADPRAPGGVLSSSARAYAGRLASPRR